MSYIVEIITSSHDIGSTLNEDSVSLKYDAYLHDDNHCSIYDTEIKSRKEASAFADGYLLATRSLLIKKMQQARVNTIFSPSIATEIVDDCIYQYFDYQLTDFGTVYRYTATIYKAE